MMDWGSISGQIDKYEKENPTMDIYSSAGTKVKFSYPENGREDEQTHASKRLRMNDIYTVASISVGQSSSIVTLKEVEGAFNTVLFKNIEEDM